MATPLSLPISYRRTTAGPDNFWYSNDDGTPYANDAAACTAVPATVRAYRTVNVAGVEKWWTTDTSNGGLHAKGNSAPSTATTAVYSSATPYAYLDTVQYDTPVGYTGGTKFWRWNNPADTTAAVRPTPVSATNVLQGSWAEVSASISGTLYTGPGQNTNGGVTQQYSTNANAVQDAALTTEITARTAGDVYLQTQATTNAGNITTNAYGIATNATAITTEAATRATNDTSLQNSITTVSSALSGEGTARATADTALQASITANTANITTNAAAITSEATTRAAAVTALQGQSATNAGNITANTSAISNEVTARAAGDATLQTQATNNAGNIAANTSNIASEITARVAGDAALQTQATNNASNITTLQGQAATNATNITTNTASITTETTARAAGDTALQTQVTANTAAATANTTAIGNKLDKLANLSDVASLPVANQNLGTAYNQDVAKGANFTVATTDRGKVFEVTTGAATVTVTLPAAATAGNGFMVLVRKVDTVTGGLVSVNGAALGIAGHTLLVWTDGTSWYNRAFFGTFDNAGNLTITAQGSLKILTSAGVDVSSQKLLNVATGTATTDGINFSQLTGRLRGAWTASTYYAQNDIVIAPAGFANAGLLVYNANAAFTSPATYTATNWALAPGQSSNDYTAAEKSQLAANTTAIATKANLVAARAINYYAAGVPDVALPDLQSQIDWLFTHRSPAIAPPSQVTGLTASSASSTSITLAWTPPASNGSAITDYLVEYRTGAAAFAAFAHTASTATASTVTGLTLSTAYDFRVSAINAQGSGPVSATSTFTTSPTVANATFTGDPTVLMYEPGYSAMPSVYASNVQKSGENYTLTSGGGFTDRVKFSLRLVGDGGISMAFAEGDKDTVFGFSLNANETSFANMEAMDHSGGGTTVNKVDAGAFTSVFTAANTPTTGFMNLERIGDTFTIGFTDINGTRVGTRVTLTTKTAAVVYPYAFLDTSSKLVRPAGKGLVV